MDATLILIDSDVELLRAWALVERLWTSNDSADVARLEAQAKPCNVGRWNPPASSSSTRTAVAPVIGFENRDKKSPAK